nr:amidohydrolase [Maliibacterium massiliense]
MILIKNAYIHTMAGPDIDQGDILLGDDGRIAGVGAHLEAERAETIDASGLVAAPGMIDAHCHLGMFEDGMDFEGADGNEATDPVTPQLRAIDGINPFDYTFTEARNGGVTCAVTGPGSANVIGGQFVALKTAGRCIEEMIVRAPHSMKAALGENPKRVYDEQHKTPSTRMATAALLRETLYRAIEYVDKKKCADADKRPDFDFQLEAMAPVIEKRIPMKIHAHRADDILTGIRIAEEFGIDYTIEHCTEGYLIADILREKKARVILGPLITERCKVELRNLRLDAPARLAEAGVKFAIMTDHGVVPIQHLPVCAALAVREGLDARTALAAITIEAARITGLDDRLGSIETGKDADVVLWSGSPLDIRARVMRVYVSGKEVYART